MTLLALALAFGGRRQLLGVSRRAVRNSTEAEPPPSARGTHSWFALVFWDSLHVPPGTNQTDRLHVFSCRSLPPLLNPKRFLSCQCLPPTQGGCPPAQRGEPRALRVVAALSVFSPAPHVSHIFFCGGRGADVPPLVSTQGVFFFFLISEFSVAACVSRVIASKSPHSPHPLCSQILIRIDASFHPMSLYSVWGTRARVRLVCAVRTAHTRAVLPPAREKGTRREGSRSEEEASRRPVRRCVPGEGVAAHTCAAAAPRASHCVLGSAATTIVTGLQPAGRQILLQGTVGGLSPLRLWPLQS